MFFNLNGTVFSDRSAGIFPRAGLRSGFSLIETMRWQNGSVRYWPAHFRRLTESAEKLNFSLMEVPATYLLFLFSELVRINGIIDGCVLRLQVFPDESATTGCGFLIECQQPEWLYRTQANSIRSIGIAEGLVKSADALSSLKTGSRMVYALAGQQAQRRGWDDALILNQFGRIAESTISNVFWVAGGKIFTPPLSEGCVAGIVRGQLLHAAGLSIDEIPLTQAMLQEADELFLTNAPRGIRSIHRLGEKRYGTAVTRAIAVPADS